LGDEARAEEERVNRRAKQTSSPPLTLFFKREFALF
jgi:hypothetical protein